MSNQNQTPQQERYERYLQSDAWRENREYLRSFPYYHTCAVCDSPEDINLHHITYSYFGTFYYPPSFIVPVCKAHHTEIHAPGHNWTEYTISLLVSHNRSSIPVEYKKHSDLLARVSKHLTDGGIIHGPLKNSPASIIGMNKDGPFIWRVSTLVNDFDYRFLKGLKTPISTRKAVVMWTGEQPEVLRIPDLAND